MVFNVLKKEQMNVKKKKREKKLEISFFWATKSVNRNQARMVFLAADTNPIEIVAHVPLCCEEKVKNVFFFLKRQRVSWWLVKTL